MTWSINAFAICWLASSASCRVLGTPGLEDQCMLGICTSIPHMLHTLRCSMAAVSCIDALLSHCRVVLCCLVVLPLLLLVRVSVCLLPSSVCLLSYLLLLTVGAHPVVPDRSRLCWGSLLGYHVKLTVAMLRHFSLLITCQAQGLCWAQRVEALILNNRERERER